ncbi:MAG: hypothetical protein WDA59_04545 [Methanofastidiosum sp.]|jgi:hypothetical protein|nr:hypothetical protein [Bacteroidales bacterium]
MAENRHKCHERQEGEQIARNLIEYRAYLGDSEVPCVRQVYGYTLMEADEGEILDNIIGEKGRYAILEYGEDPCWNYEFVLYVSDSLSVLRPIFDLLCIECDKDLTRSMAHTNFLILYLWLSKEINDMDKANKNEA